MLCKKKKPEVKKENEGEGDDEVDTRKPKASNPLDSLPVSSFVLDDFKKEFLNTKDQKPVLEKFWSIYDPKGYSLWFIHYQKSSTQGKVIFQTSNLKGNFLQKLDHFRKYCFSVHGVYGKEPNLEVEGVWMWKGTDIPQELKDHESYEYLTIKQLDPKSEVDRKLLEEFWLNLEPGKIVNGNVVVDAESFK